MKIVQLNTTCGTGSTGKLCVSISDLLTCANMENYILYSQGKSDHPLGIRYSNAAYKKLQALKSRIFGNFGFQSPLATLRLMAHLWRLQPDVVHIHNIHSHDCHLGMLLRWLKKRDVKIVWTFHDCWAFTGLCTYFDAVGCDRWKTGCHHCPQRRQTSWLFDRSASMQRRKMKLLTGLDLTVVTPSQWLADLVGKTFLKDCPVCVIPNGIDLSVFRPSEADVRSRWGCEEKHIVLGVAQKWGERKGLDVFAALAQRLGAEYQVVLVGTDANTEAMLPKQVITIRRTDSQQELAKIYTAADVFVNPTREDNYPTVNMEALACGTPVITFAVGGSAEMVDDTCGCAVGRNDLEALEEKIRLASREQIYPRSACLAHAAQFDQKIRLAKYLDLYRSLL